MAGERVASISQQCPACGGTIDTTDAEPLARIACPKCDEKVRVERSFDNFMLVETLGVGGMGTVYKARDTLLDRFVALKLLRKDIGGGIDQTAQLRQEARVAASVNHPNVIQVFSSGSDHGQFYLVMELVDHGSLDDFIEQRKRLPEEQALEAGIQVAKGLRAAHAKGLIHRDVKPANILFADEHTAKIGDFGLAGVAAEKAETLGEIWGTPYYVAPERLNNEPEDFRSDIYSLGATLFHAVAGKAPIEGETNSAVALLNLKKKPFDLRRIAPDASAATARVFHRMIAPNPLHRFSSYDELVGELERAQRALIRKESIDFVRAGRKRRRLLTIGGALLMTLIAVGGFLFLHKSRPRRSTVALVPGPSAIPINELERQFAKARAELIHEHHKVAHGEFARLAMEATNRQPLYDWLRLNEGLAALIGREPSQARQAFQEVENAGQSGFTKQDADLAKFFVATAKTMSAPVKPSAANAQWNGNTFEAFAILLFAVKNITEAEITDATPLLEQFANVQPQGKFAWINEYKPIAQKYLEDCRLYLSWKKEAKAGGNPTADLEKVQGIKKKLKMHSAISEEISTEEKNLARRMAQQQTSETARREQERRKKMAQEFPTKKIQWLVDWKNKLIEDLNHFHYAGKITDANGTQYAGIESATPEKLTMKVPPYGTVQLDWAKIPSKTLLAISMSFIQSNASDTADRRWLCAIFADATRQTEDARHLAEAAAKSKAEYHDQIDFLIPGPTPH
jgi:serine/threonine protein kinase